MLRTLIASTLLLAGLAQAGLSDMRATSEQDRVLPWLSRKAMFSERVC